MTDSCPKCGNDNAHLIAPIHTGGPYSRAAQDKADHGRAAPQQVRLIGMRCEVCGHDWGEA